MKDDREPIIIGDQHGCLIELKELLDLIVFDPSKHRLIFLGDALDRGDYSTECFQFVRSLCESGKAEMVLANHEAKHIAYREREKQIKLTGGKNNIFLSENDKAAHFKLSDADLDWAKTLPIKIHIKDNWYVIHAGLQTAYSFEDQHPDKILRCRYLDKEGKMVSLHKYNKSPMDYVFWADVWQGKESIIFGHETFSQPKIFKNKNNTCIGIDTGVVYGGYLTAYMFDQQKFVQVKAKKKYYHSDYRNVE